MSDCTDAQEKDIADAWARIERNGRIVGAIFAVLWIALWVGAWFCVACK